MKPVYDADLINQPVQLYAGPLSAEYSNGTLSGNGTIRFEWLPKPRIHFQFDVPQASREMPNIGKTRLIAVNANRRLMANVTFLGANESNEQCARGEVVGDETSSIEVQLRHVIFHLPNFGRVPGEFIRDETAARNWAGRLAMEAAGWKITLDRIKPPESPLWADPLYDKLDDTAGYAITHVGRIERSDGSDFSVEDVDKALRILFHFFSFCRGAWCSPQLPVGFNASDDRVWERWQARPTDNWKRVGTWLNDSRGMNAALPGYFERFGSDVWEETIRVATFWYVEANESAGGIEGATILIYTALELLAWTLLVKDRAVLSEDGFDKLPAMDKLRLLASASDIPLATPASLVEISKLAKEYNWSDAPQSLASIRNALVHPKVKLRQKGLITDTRTLKECWRLGLWFLELILLRLTKYEGVYVNRLDTDGAGNRKTASVPWSKK
jgi:hypothetical protein